MGNSPDFDLAGLSDLTSLVGRRVPTGEISVIPGVKLSPNGDRLEWPWANFNRQQRRLVKPTPAMFTAFVNLAGKRESPEAVRAFAAKWGDLSLTDDGQFALSGRSREGDFFSEPIESWYYFAGRAEAVLSIAAALRQGKVPEATLWQELTPLTDRFTNRERVLIMDSPVKLWITAQNGYSKVAALPIETQRLFLWIEVNLWIKLSGAGLVVAPSDVSARKLRLEVNYSNRLFAAVAFQLALTVCDQDGPQQCPGCDQLRHIPPGRKFCTFCKGEASRRADARRQEKIREARRLHSEGLSTSAIVEKLNVRNTARNHAAQTVRRWIKEGH
jgi:hypothetical protein